MDTLRVDICYRPLRIAWAVQSADRDSFRRAVRLSHALRGGRYNPIVFSDRPDEAKRIVARFRADVVVPVGESEEVNGLPDLFPHLPSPFFPDRLFLRHRDETARPQALDMQNALFHWQGTPDWKRLEDQGIRHFAWEADDPLADTFLLAYGDYPPAEDIGIDYAAILGQATMAIVEKIAKTGPITPLVLNHPGPAYLTKHGMWRHYSVRPGWDYPGFFVGDASSIDDLACFWNMRAADLDVHFLDAGHLDRYELIKPQLEQRIRAGLAHLDEHRRKLGIWARDERLEQALKLFEGKEGLVGCRLFDGYEVSGVNPPMMILGEESSLGVLGRDEGKPRVSFALKDTPFSSNSWFHNQYLVASVSLRGSVRGTEQHVFSPPYAPELNELFARQMLFHHDRLRVEPERLGIVLTATDHDALLSALPVSALIEQVFGLAGLKVRTSGAGLITRQLIARLGGVDGARVFKIPGVRRLLKTHGPAASFTKRAALQLIGSKDPHHPDARFEDHQDLYIEPRPIGTKLTPPMVFAYLVEKGLFRIGAELTCPTCNLSSWTALDALKQQVVCDLCGATFDATRQLVGGEFHYRRSGVLGLEKNTQGAVPVTLVLQQLNINLSAVSGENMWSPSIELTPESGLDLPVCEIDLVMIIPGFPRSRVILGECKDEGGVIDGRDVENLRRIADALPADRFEAYILLAKLSPFSAEEIALARTLNGPHQHRVIMLTARELEPYDVYERREKELGERAYGGSPDELAHVTSRLYFTAAEAAGGVAQAADGVAPDTGQIDGVRK